MMWARCPRLVIVGLAMALIASCNSHDAGSKPATKTEPAPAAQPEAVKPAPKPAPAPAPQPEKPPAAAPPPPAPAAAREPTKAAPPATPRDEAKDWFITTERAKELFDKKEVDGKQVIFVDARTYVEFTEGHIRGAMCYSTKYTQGAPQAKLKNYLPGSAVVLYCHGETCTDSIDVGRYFQSLHMSIGPIFVIRDGFPGWQKAYPNLVDKGPEVGFE